MVISVYIFLKDDAIGQGYFLIHGDNSDAIGNSSEGHMIINGAGCGDVFITQAIQYWWSDEKDNTSCSHIILKCYGF